MNVPKNKALVVRLVFQASEHEFYDQEFFWYPGLTVAALLQLAKVYEQYPQLRARPCGVFGKIVAEDALLKPGARLEIYASLQCDPKEARRKRARVK